jgi:hypothetical protein
LGFGLEVNLPQEARAASDQLKESRLAQWMSTVSGPWPSVADEVGSHIWQGDPLRIKGTVSCEGSQSSEAPGTKLRGRLA